MRIVPVLSGLIPLTVPGVPQTGTSSNSGSTSVAKSDTGAQRPVKLNKSEFHLPWLRCKDGLSLQSPCLRR